MKSISNIMLWVLANCILCACENPLEIEEPVFEVTGYEIEDTFDEEGNALKQVAFSLNGNADVISFYSGEIGGDYNYRDGRILELQGLNASFSSNLNSGTQGAETLTIFASVDFNGVYEIEDIHAATWIDITDRFTIAPLVVGGQDFVPSGVVDLADLTGLGNPLYLAFRQITRNQAIYGGQTQIRIRDWLLASQTELGLTVLATQGTAGWVLVEHGLFRPSRPSVSASQIILRGNHGTLTSHPAEFQAETEAWVISQPIYAGDVDLGPDRPLPIKSREDLPLETFIHEYSGPGEYDAVFMGSNVNIEREHKIYKNIKVVIPQ